MKEIRISIKDMRYINNLFRDQIFEIKNGKAVFTSEQAQEKFLNEVRKSPYMNGQQEV